MDGFDQNDLEKETNDSHNICYQNEVQYKEKENDFIKRCKCGLFSLVFLLKG